MEAVNSIQSKTLTIPLLNVEKNSERTEIDYLLDNLPKEAVQEVCWFPVKYIPDVYFAMGYSSDCIFLKYYITETYFKATYTRFQDPVYKDSCVEFFVQLPDDTNYYNFEFNALGTGRICYCKDRNTFQELSETAVNNIKRWINITKPQAETDLYKWQITIAIPVEAFSFHELTKFNQKKLRANFYKCGDDLPEAHYISWNKILSEMPDFHQPKYFGDIYLAN